MSKTGRTARTAWIMCAGLIAVLVAAGCGDDDGQDGALDDLPTAPDPNGVADIPLDDPGGDPADPAGGDADVVVTVDGQEYPVTIVQTCEISGSDSTNQALAVYGFAESGERIELTFSAQSGDTTPSGEDMYFGSLGIASGGEGSFQTESDEPWPFLTVDGSEVSGTVTMEDRDGGGSAEVSFEVSCAGHAGSQ